MEAPPAKNLLLTVVFLSTFAVLVGTIPSGFLESNPEYRTVSVPSIFDAIETEQYADTYIINITGDYYTLKWGKTEFGHDMRFTARRIYYDMYNTHTFPFWIWYDWNAHQMEWINNNGVSRALILSANEIESDSEDGIARYKLQCKHFYMDTWVGYNTTTYSNLTDAWDNDGVSLMFGIQWDEKGTGMNAWNLIGMLLFFQIPDIHWTLNAIIALPLWIMIAYLIFSFIMAVIKSLPLT